METLGASATAPVSIFSPKKNPSPRFLKFPIASKNDENEADHLQQSDSSNTNNNIVPVVNNGFSLSPLSKDAAMGLVLSAATGRGWTTGSGMEGPPAPAGFGNDSGTATGMISTFPWSLFTKSPRRRMRVAFTCNICGQRTTRAINPHAYTDGTVFVQCCGCNVFHKLVDHLNLFQELNCYVNPKNYIGENGELGFKYLDMDDGNDDGIFPLL